MYRSLNDYGAGALSRRRPDVSTGLGKLSRDGNLPPLRAIPTFMGVLFVPWQLGYLQALIRDGELGAGDVDRTHPRFQPFLRRLFMLAALEALAGQERGPVCDLAARLRPRQPRQKPLNPAAP